MIADSVRVPAAVLAGVQDVLRAAGLARPRGREGVALLIGRSGALADELVVPEHEAGFDWFRVPLASRRSLAQSLAGTGRQVLAQVHSHPSRAYHSAVDDAMALPRRAGNLSLVVPDFARRPDLMDGSTLYALQPDGRWALVPLAHLEVEP